MRQRHVTVLIACGNDAERQSYLEQLQSQDGLASAGEVGTADETLAHLKSRPNVMLLDAQFLVEHGSHLITTLQRASSDTRIILLTSDVPQSLVLDAVCRGAVGYLEKAETASALPKAIRAVHAGHAWIPRRMVGHLVECLIHRSPVGQMPDSFARKPRRGRPRRV